LFFLPSPPRRKQPNYIKVYFSFHFPEIQVDLLTHEEDQLDGQAMCPYSPHHNSTFLMTGNGDYYSATTMDFTGSDPAIYRIMGPSPRLRTAQYNSKWLNGKMASSLSSFSFFFVFFFLSF
jgi:semaphorin 5